MLNEELLHKSLEDLLQLRTDSFDFRMIKLKDINCIFDVYKIGSYGYIKN